MPHPPGNLLQIVFAMEPVVPGMVYVCSVQAANGLGWGPPALPKSVTTLGV